MAEDFQNSGFYFIDTSSFRVICNDWAQLSDYFVGGGYECQSVSEVIVIVPYYAGVGMSGFDGVGEQA